MSRAQILSELKLKYQTEVDNLNATKLTIINKRDTVAAELITTFRASIDSINVRLLELEAKIQEITDAEAEL